MGYHGVLVIVHGFVILCFYALIFSPQPYHTTVAHDDHINKLKVPGSYSASHRNLLYYNVNNIGYPYL